MDSEIGANSSVDQAATERAHESAESPVSTLDHERLCVEAANAYAMAEALVRWEDDLPAAELHFVATLYAQATQLSQQARLGAPSSGEAHHTAPFDPPTYDRRVPSTSDERTHLLQVRYQALLAVSALPIHRARPARIVWTRRSLRALALGGALALAISAFLLREVIVDQLDLGNLSRGKHWTASSAVFPDTPAQGVLSNFGDMFFFHTALDPSPWLEVDLGSEATVARATIRNRSDCCQARAIPLVLEASRDHQTWQHVARTDQPFQVWRIHFAPRRARWLRLLVLRQTYFHLQSVVFRS